MKNGLSGFYLLYGKRKGPPERGDAMRGLLHVPGDRVGCVDPSPPRRVWCAPGPLHVRGSDWLAALAVVPNSLDRVLKVSALNPGDSGIGLPPCSIFGVEFNEDDVAVGYAASLDDLYTVGHWLFLLGELLCVECGVSPCPQCTPRSLLLYSVICNGGAFIRNGVEHLSIL